jgi:predicted 3-demethylubiquinone-9 3-methyltransferase (glyoxalase superfamily)
MSITITPFLWYVDNADAAIARYLEVFDDAEIVDETRMPDGSLFIATIRLQGQELVLMNGGPDHQLSEAFSLFTSVETQEDIDRISDQLIAGGGEQGPCGWLTDAFGLTWQVIPTRLMELMGDPDPVKAGRVRDAMLQMKRISIDGLQEAYDDKATV